MRLVACLLALGVLAFGAGCGGGGDDGGEAGGARTTCADLDAPAAKAPGTYSAPSEPLDG